MKIRTAILLVFMALACGVRAHEPVTSSITAEWGNSLLYSTYLSPVSYHGQSLAVAGRWEKPWATSPEHLSMVFDGRVEGAVAGIRATGRKMYQVQASFAWGMLWGTNLCGTQLRLAGGVDVGLNAGVLYSPTGGNNPANAIANLMLSLRAVAKYPLKIKRLPVTICDEVRLPSIGVALSPEYGESYYEISLGNRKHLASAAWWGNHFGIDNLLCADLHFGQKALRIGYRFRAATSYLHKINQQVFTHAVVVGITF